MKTRLYVTAILFMAFSIVFVSLNTHPSKAQSNVSPPRRILGISARRNSDYSLIKKAGIGWVRLGFRFPFEDRIGGKLSDDFLRNLEEAKKIRSQGLRIMGITPLAGSVRYDAKDNQTAWRPGIPAWAGPISSDTYYDTYEKACEELGRQTRGIVDMWQISNEMDIDVFRGPLSLEQAERYLTAGGRGVKKGNPAAKADINPAIFDPGESIFRDFYAKLGQTLVRNADSRSGERLFRDIYSKHDNPFDYAGIDGYYGSWLPGGPQDWVLVIDKIHQITGKPVLINEWGFSSLEGSGQPLAKKVGIPVCDNQKWNNEWRTVHSPEEQAAYFQIALKIFGTYPNVAGCFIYTWGDDATCWHCGQKGCPSECAWGIVDTQGKPKPAYYTVQTLAHEFF